MSAKKAPNIKMQILQAIYEHGPMDVPGLQKHIKGYQKNSIHSKALELMHDGLLNRDDNMVWSLREGVTPQTLETGELNGGDEEDQPQGTEKEGKAAGAAVASRAALDAKGMFETLLKSVAVKPPEVIPTIADIFFGGDIDDLKWLETVLKRHAAGWVAPNQIRLILSSWSHTRGLPYDEKEFAIESPETGKGAKEEAREPKKPAAAQVMEDAGIAFQVVKDKDGDWVPKAGGVLSYEAALDRCERLNAIKAMGVGPPEEAAEEAEEEGGGKPTGKGRSRARTVEQMVLEKIVDNWIDGKSGKGGEESEIVKGLREDIKRQGETIQAMKDQQDREWRERIESNLAAIAARDPWSDPVEVQRIRQAIGVNQSAVTDSSPAVQLIKDSADKVDKNVNRLIGLVERVALQEDVFRPEETRSAEEKESKAEALLGEAQQRQRSTDLRKRVFGK